MRTLVQAAVDGGEPLHAATVASALEISPRTLQRWLGAEGTSFRALLDGARYARARELLRDPRRTITAIALDLGYADQGHFARALRRWCGQSPRALRRSLPLLSD